MIAAPLFSFVPCGLRHLALAAFWVSVVIQVSAQGKFPEVPETTPQTKPWTNTIQPIPERPDYRLPQSWALNPVLLPNHELRLPKGSGRHTRSLSKSPAKPLADVFFIHPTMLLEGEAWNADVHDAKMNEEVDRWPIRHQASAFASAGRVFAPRYRQAHVRIFSLGDSLSWAAAEVAYQDVKAAFVHFLESWNGERPIVLAGHSQGSFHGRRLLQEFFDGTELADRLVAAYFPGMDMYAHEFGQLPLCATPVQTGCLCTWMTYGKDHLPPWLVRKMEAEDFDRVLITHPVTWRVDGGANAYAAHLGVVRPSFRLSKPGAMRGEISPQGVLWVDAPKVVGGRLLQRDNWHSGDINLFWVNVYNNVLTRAHEWHTNRP